MALLGEGLENIAYVVSGELILRFSKEPTAAGRAARVVREARILGVVAGLSALPVPEPVLVVPEQGCLAYRYLPGTPLLDIPEPGIVAATPPVAAALGGLLSALHSAPAEPLRAMASTDDQPLDGWLADAGDLYRTLRGDMADRFRRPVERFLGERPPERGSALAFSHNDLGIDHVLVDPAGLTVTGIIDWSEAALVDPAYDLGLLLRDLGPAATEAVLGCYSGDRAELPALRERAGFYARCSVLEDLRHGLDAGGSRYLEKGLAALEWLFPA